MSFCYNYQQSQPPQQQQQWVEKEDNVDATVPLLTGHNNNDYPLTATATTTSSLWTEYPGLRRNLMEPPMNYNSNIVFLPTGGNALQAFPRDVIMRNIANNNNNYNNSNNGAVVSVVVPEGCKPGRTLLVQIPSDNSNSSVSWVSVTIPPGTHAGHVMLVQVPITTVTNNNTTTYENNNNNNKLNDESNNQNVIVMGEPVQEGRILETTSTDTTTTTTNHTTTAAAPTMMTTIANDLRLNVVEAASEMTHNNTVNISTSPPLATATFNDCDSNNQQPTATVNSTTRNNTFTTPHGQNLELL